MKDVPRGKRNSFLRFLLGSYSLKQRHDLPISFGFPFSSDRTESSIKRLVVKWIGSLLQEVIKIKCDYPLLFHLCFLEFCLRLFFLLWLFRHKKVQHIIPIMASFSATWISFFELYLLENFPKKITSKIKDQRIKKKLSCLFMLHNIS